MIHVLNGQIPYPTDENNFFTWNLSLLSPVIKRVVYLSKSGSTTPTYCGIRILDSGRNILPSPGYGLDRWLSVYISSTLYYPLEYRFLEAPYNLTFQAYNFYGASVGQFSLFIETTDYYKMRA